MKDKSLAEQFADYDTLNPHVYAMFKRFALEALAAGKTVLSASLICERIRWEVDIVTRGDQFKINNNYRAFYSRKFMQEFPWFGETFRTRVQHSVE